MAEVKWIKVSIDIFDNRKIKIMRSLENGDSFVLIWIMLLTLAGQCNDYGAIYLTKSTPYSISALATIFSFDESIIQSALKIFVELDMIQIENDYISITGWEEYQNIEGLEKIREQGRKRAAAYRKKRKAERNVTVTCRNDGETDENAKEDTDQIQMIIDLYHNICVSFPQIVDVTNQRKKLILARLSKYSLEDFERAFQKAEASDFLSGSNNHGWNATLDWILDEVHFVHILEGMYDNRSLSTSPSCTLGSAEIDAIKKVLTNP